MIAYSHDNCACPGAIGLGWSSTVNDILKPLWTNVGIHNRAHRNHKEARVYAVTLAQKFHHEIACDKALVPLLCVKQSLQDWLFERYVRATSGCQTAKMPLVKPSESTIVWNDVPSTTRKCGI